MKFEFQFESLLSIRRHEEKEEQQELSQLLSAEMGLEEKLSGCKAQIEKFNQSVSDKDKQTASDIRQQYNLKQDLQERFWSLQRDYDQLQKDIKQQRELLLEANKRTQMLEKLESRERAKFVERYQDIEQKQQNEIATQIYNRRI